MVKNFSKYQEAIFDAVENTDKNIVVNATAGSGKTTTIIEASKLIPKSSKVLFLAFNKSIVEELKSRLPSNVDCMTFHSLGLNTLSNNYKIIQFAVNHKKINDGFKKLKIPQSLSKDYGRISYNVCKAVEMAKVNVISPYVRDVIKLCEYYDINLKYHKKIDFSEYSLVLDLYRKANKITSNVCDVDFADMIYLPAVLDNVVFKKYDVVIVDEVQDLNIAQHRMMSKLIKSSGRFIAVGDICQAIYGFAGASSKTFMELESKPNTISLPLSISYRCGKRIVEYVKSQENIVSNIEAWEYANEGEVIHGGSLKTAKSNDLVVCRTLAPLIDAYIELLKNKIPAKIQGNDLRDGMLDIVSKHKYLTIEQILGIYNDKLNELHSELEYLGVKKPKQTKKYSDLAEKISVLETVSEYYNIKTGSGFMEVIEDMFSESKDDNIVKLMSIHKSKGLEADNVFVIDPQDIPWKFAKTKEDYEQEYNLKFVAYTRAKKRLILVNL